ncbi:hypothetical protein C2E23DRAFT_759541 [Lenzites betulinus]|nr:hypothetical protein C2E23DRAFT_759541 [Lenzites betulinus]
MALHLSTIISRNTAHITAHITAHLAALQPTLAHNPLLYTISTPLSTPGPTLSALVSALQTLSPHSAGCLAAALPSSSRRASWQHYTAVSLASFDRGDATLFRSTIPGRKAAQVGRWHAARKSTQSDPVAPAHSENEEVDWEVALSNAYDGQDLPPELARLSAEDVHTVLYFSDNAPEGLTSSLSKFGSANKLGLIGASTPFVTGRPYTLFHNDRIYSDGAVGLCLTSSRRPTTYSSFPGLEALTRPMVVTSSEGNMVNALDNANPSGLLLHAIRNHPSFAGREPGISPELRLYMGTLKQKQGGHELDQLSYITSGDPSRGSLALDTDAAPVEGTLVQMYLLSPSAPPDLVGEAQKHHTTNSSQRLAFVSTSLDEMEPPALSDDPAVDDTIVLENTFLAASENGSIVSRSSGGVSERSWKCSIPGATMGLEWLS